MTRCSILEYAQAVRGRYLKSPKKMKTKILDEFVVTTGLHRKAVIRLLNRVSGPLTPAGTGRVGSRRRGRPRLYDLEVMATLKVVWEATDRLCSKRLHPFLPEVVAILKAKGELRVTERGGGSALSAECLHHRPYHATLAPGPAAAWSWYH